MVKVYLAIQYLFGRNEYDTYWHRSEMEEVEETQRLAIQMKMSAANHRESMGHTLVGTAMRDPKLKY